MLFPASGDPLGRIMRSLNIVQLLEVTTVLVLSSYFFLKRRSRKHVC